MKEKQIRVRLPLIVYVDGLIFYDAQNQLLSETIGRDTTSYTYDTAGNIRSITGPSVSKSFSYNDSGDWKDLLTSVTVNGTTRSITYEEENGVTIGNPLSYFNGTQYTLAWQNGRQLASLSSGGKSATYTYGADGIRTGKTVTDASGTTTYQYTTQNGQIARQSWTANGTAYQMDFIYDAAGRPLSMYYRTKTASQADFNGDSYYYETNQQGDVTGLYKITYDASTKSLSATRVASYEYDAWGNVTYSTGTMAKINPLKYRGYYHDVESGFYYLQSRYYDPAIGRFINADGQIDKQAGFVGLNLFIYAANNPMSYSDPSGRWVVKWSVKWFTKNLAKPVASFAKRIWKKVFRRTTTIGTTGVGALAAKVGLAMGVAADANGNIGLVYTASAGGGTPSASLNAYITRTTATDIASLAGTSYQVGGSVDIGVGVGLEYTNFTDTTTNTMYHGYTVSVGVGAPTPVEMHGDVATTMILLDVNIFDCMDRVYTAIMDW